MKMLHFAVYRFRPLRTHQYCSEVIMKWKGNFHYAKHVIKTPIPTCSSFHWLNSCRTTIGSGCVHAVSCFTVHMLATEQLSFSHTSLCQKTYDVSVGQLAVAEISGMSPSVGGISPTLQHWLMSVCGFLASGLERRSQRALELDTGFLASGRR